MSRVEQTETEINSHWCDGWEGKAKHIHHVASTLAAEVDELQAKLDQVRSEIGCARGQRTTQYCADAVEYKRRLDAVVAMLRDEGTITCPDCCGAGHWIAEGPGPSYVIPRPDGNHSVTCERCGGDFDSIGSGVIEPDEEYSLYARAVAIAEGRDNG